MSESRHEVFERSEQAIPVICVGSKVLPDAGRKQGRWGGEVCDVWRQKHNANPVPASPPPPSIVCIHVELLPIAIVACVCACMYVNCLSSYGTRSLCFWQRATMAAIRFFARQRLAVPATRSMATWWSGVPQVSGGRADLPQQVIKRMTRVSKTAFRVNSTAVGPSAILGPARPDPGRHRSL